MTAHLTDDEITDYCHDLLDELQLARIEEHILICLQCQTAVWRLRTLLKVAEAEKDERQDG